MIGLHSNESKVLSERVSLQHQGCLLQESPRNACVDQGTLLSSMLGPCVASISEEMMPIAGSFGFTSSPLLSNAASQGRS